jgi:hypothetical protein
MLLVCVAKSRKYGGRCIAGVEVAEAGGNFRVVYRAGEPRWIRPIGGTDHGEVPEQLVQRISLLDVVDFPGLVPAPDGYQSENCRLGAGKPGVVASLPKKPDLLERFATRRSPPIFGNRGKAVHVERIGEVDHSLLLACAEDARFYWLQTERNRLQLRACFEYAHDYYDLPVTDPEFERQLFGSKQKLDVPHCYLTLSLGLPFEGWHFKLIAGVFVL